MMAWTFRLACSAGTLPATAVTATTLMRGSNNAMQRATASSMPGSQSIITFLVISPPVALRPTPRIAGLYFSPMSTTSLPRYQNDAVQDYTRAAANPDRGRSTDWVRHVRFAERRRMRNRLSDDGRRRRPGANRDNPRSLRAC